MRRVCILGATGSIGDSTLEVLALHPDAFDVVSLSAHRDVEKMLSLVLRWSPQRVAMADPKAMDLLRDRYRAAAPQGHRPPEWLSGPEALDALAADPEVDLVVAGVVGIAGLSSILAAARSGKSILLANKESVVCGGHLLREALVGSSGEVLPIDSEHNAVFQCLGSQYRCFAPPDGVRSLTLTASGGPFRTWSAEQIRQATREQALQHPNWSMGAKITIDSATMMNKALEVIEAHWLFAMPSASIEVLVHPQSVIHSMVEMSDGSVLAQLGSPDMRVPIAHALHHPERRDSGARRLRWSDHAALSFEAPDEQRFPALSLGRAALEQGTAACTVLNAANEVAVEAFLAGQVGFGDIAAVVAHCLHLAMPSSPSLGLGEIIDLDQWARSRARERIA